jgi:competence protein ComEA
MVPGTERMPPDGAWPSILRNGPPVAEPPTVPLLLAGVDDAGASTAPASPLRVGRGPTGRAHDGGVPADPPLPAESGPLIRLLRTLLPPSWRGARIDPGRPGATALALVAAAAAVAAAVGVWQDRPQAEPVGSAGALSAVVVTSAPATDQPVPDGPPVPAGPLVLSVSGKVERPGLIELPDGARVADALDAAGGALPGTDLSSLNLARRVVDGEQIAVGVPPAADAAPGPGATGSGSAVGDGPLDLNSATEGQLDALPGVGPVTAQRILEWRRLNGRFSRVEQLREIEGVGERRFAQIRELVVV